MERITYYSIVKFILLNLLSKILKFESLYLITCRPIADKHVTLREDTNLQ